jgi:hypothetical protein
MAKGHQRAPQKSSYTAKGGWNPVTDTICGGMVALKGVGKPTDQKIAERLGVSCPGGCRQTGAHAPPFCRRGWRACCAGAAGKTACMLRRFAAGAAAEMGPLAKRFVLAGKAPHSILFALAAALPRDPLACCLRLLRFALNGQGVRLGGRLVLVLFC